MGTWPNLFDKPNEQSQACLVKRWTLGPIRLDLIFRTDLKIECHLGGDVAAHVEDSVAVVGRIHAAHVFQTAQMALVSAVEEVLRCD